jgi:hypothetical protein
MIKLRSLISEMLVEKMSYEDLMRSSDPARKDRASRIPAKSLVAKSVNDREAWKFSYKTPRDENTTGLRHQGFIYFYKEQMTPGDNAMQVPCSVDCSCPDYRFRFSYANKSQDAGENGPNSLNKGLNYPSSINRGPGLCKHLIALKEFLRTNIEGEPVPSPEPTEPPKQAPVVVPKTPPEDTMPPEEPEVKPEEPVDPTQTPEPEEEPIVATKPVDDPTQTPQEPEKEEEPTDEEPKPIKEWTDKIELFKALDEFCKSNPIFII